MSSPGRISSLHTKTAAFHVFTDGSHGICSHYGWCAWRTCHLYSGKRYHESFSGAFCLEIYNRKCIDASCNYQYISYDSAFPAHRSTNRYLFCYLLVEYAKRGNKLVSIVRITTETLSGIPSIVYGLFGYLMFVIAFGWGLSFFGGALTLSIMVLPTIMRTTEEALLSVPDSYREGSFGLGAGRLRTIFKVVLPSAVPGILSGVILAIGRIVGETAALIFTSGTTAEIPKSLFDSGCTLAVHMYKLLSEGLYTKQAYATAVVLLVMVVIINAASGKLAKKLQAK